MFGKEFITIIFCDLEMYILNLKNSTETRLIERLDKPFL